MSKKEENKGRDYYREQQKKYKELAKANVKWVHVSKLPPRVILGEVQKDNTQLVKGRTYRKGEEQ